MLKFRGKTNTQTEIYDLDGITIIVSYNSKVRGIDRWVYFVILKYLDLVTPKLHLETDVKKIDNRTLEEFIKDNERELLLRVFK